MHILIFEPRLSGHHAHYLKYILQAARDVATKVTLVTARDLHDLDEFRVHLIDACDDINLILADESNDLQGYQRDFYHFRLLRRQIMQQKPDFVWIPYVDRLAQIAGLLSAFNIHLVPPNRNVSVIGLLFRGAAAYQWNTALGTFKDKISLRLACRAGFSRLFTVDNLLHQYLLDNDISNCHLMPEPIEPFEITSSENVRTILGLPEADSAQFIVSLGGQDKRKGVDLLITAFVNSQLKNHDYLILAGKLDCDVKMVLDSHRQSPLFNNIIVRDELLSVHQIQLFLSIADYVAVPYPKHIGSSSFVLRAASAKKSLIASDSGWVGWTTRRYNLGRACDVTNSAELAIAISETMSQNAENLKAQADFASITNFHTLENFKNTWKSSVS